MLWVNKMKDLKSLKLNICWLGRLKISHTVYIYILDIVVVFKFKNTFYDSMIK